MHALSAGSSSPWSRARFSSGKVVCTSETLQGIEIQTALYELLLNLEQDDTLCQPRIRIQQMHKTVPLAQPVEPHARPRRQVVAPDLVVADGEAHKGQLVHEPADVLELELLAREVDVAAAVRPRLGLVLALTLVAAVLNVAAAEAVEGVDVELDLDVGLEALGVGVVGG